MAGYTRQKSAEITSGAVARASDIAAELNQVQAAFSASTGHTHSGTSGEGAPITVIGPAQDIVATAALLRPKTDNTIDLGSATYEYKNGYFDGTVYADGLNVDGTFTLNGTALTATFAELNALDGITASVAELNVLDGITATTTELNYTDGVTSNIQTQLNSKANASVTLTAGNGLTGGGDLSTNRTLSVGAGDGVSVGATTVGVDSTVVRTTRTISSGTGISGGGNLGADRTLALEGRALALHNMATVGLVTQNVAGSYTARSIVGGDGIDVTNGNGASGNPTAAVDSSVVRTTRNLVAGNGLSGGGTLSSDRTFTLGTPSSITATSTNSVTTTSHTHAITEATIRTLIADGTFGEVGTYAFLRSGGFDVNFNRGTTYAGSVLRYSGITTREDVQNENVESNGVNNDAPSGTWRAMGSVSGVASRYSMTLFLRIS